MAQYITPLTRFWWTKCSAILTIAIQIFNFDQFSRYIKAEYLYIQLLQ